MNVRSYFNPNKSYFLRMEFLHSSQIKVVFVFKESVSGAWIPGKDEEAAFFFSPPLCRMLGPSFMKHGRIRTKKLHDQVNQILGRVIKIQEKIHLDFSPASWNPSYGFFQRDDIALRISCSSYLLISLFQKIQRDWICKWTMARAYIKIELWSATCPGNQALYLQ